MIKTKKTILYILTSTLTISIPVLIFGLVNTLVSIKYETENPGDCISSVSGDDLCSAINRFEIIIVINILIIITLIIFRKRIIKK
jgi:hypothetical protein